MEMNSSVLIVLLLTWLIGRISERIDMGYTQVITLQYTWMSREAWESGEKLFGADCSAANIAIKRRSERIDMCYTEVITLQCH